MANTLTPPYTVAQVVEENIFDLLQLTDLTEESRQDFMDELMESVDGAVIDAIAEKLSEEELTVFEALLDSEEEAALEPFFTEKNINVEELYVAKSMEYKIELLQLRFGEDAVTEK